MTENAVRAYWFTVELIPVIVTVAWVLAASEHPDPVSGMTTFELRIETVGVVQLAEKPDPKAADAPASVKPDPNLTSTVLPATRAPELDVVNVMVQVAAVLPARYESATYVTPLTDVADAVEAATSIAIAAAIPATSATPARPFLDRNPIGSSDRTPLPGRGTTAKLDDVTRLALLLLLIGATAAFAGTRTDPIPSLSTTDQTAGMPAAAIDVTAIPLGTRKSSTTPKAGYLDRCGGTPTGGPPVKIPPWVGASTWDATKKAAVRGDVTYTAQFTATHSGTKLVLKGNGLPAEAGTFPVAKSDPAYAYNPDPDGITSHSISLSLAYDPTSAASPQCERGTIGITTTGIPILDGFDAGGYDAAAVEVQDVCHGHPNQFVGYHYHGLSPCQLDASSRTHTTLVGWALDGYGIYVEYDAKGKLLTNAALDACHGQTSVVPWHGKSTRIYHYDMTVEFPYTVGCFHGTPASFLGMTMSSQNGGPPPPP